VVPRHATRRISAAMDEVGIDLSARRPKKLDLEMQLRRRGSRARSRRHRSTAGSLSRPGETLDGLQEFLGFDRGVGFVAGGERAGDAVADMVIEDREG
jgi:hypothetical protein